MTQPASLNRSDLAKRLYLRLLMAAGILVVVGFALFPTYSMSLLYGAAVFLVNNLVFALYTFRFSGSRSAVLMLQAFGRGVFLKLILFALALMLIYRFDESSRAYAQSAAIIGVYFVLQALQIAWSVTLSKHV